MSNNEARSATENTTEPTEAFPPVDEASLERAADTLEAIGKHHQWWPDGPSWRDSDPIAREEFLDIIAMVVRSYLAPKELHRKASKP